MPLGTVYNAAANQVLAEPVSNFYKGKAMRAAIRRDEVATDAEVLRQELLGKELADYPEDKRLEREEGQVRLQKMETEIDKMEQEFGVEHMTRSSEVVTGVTNKYIDALRADPENALPQVSAEIRDAYRAMGGQYESRYEEQIGDGVLSLDELIGMNTAASVP